MPLDFSNHPCFNESIRHKYGRVHLPVAPKCNIQCYYCNRKYDCVSESRPGVTSTVLSPGQAIAYLQHVVDRDPQIRVVGIAGPGDPFANADETMETLRRVRALYPDMLLCVATNGLEIAPHIEELAELSVSHVTITMNTVDPVIASNIYGWVRTGKRVVRGIEAARLLCDRQQVAIARLKECGVVVKVNCILIPGTNLEHAEVVAKRARELGADILNCIPLYPVEGSEFERYAPPSASEVTSIRIKAAQHMPQMHHCTRCRADAVGLLDQGIDGEYTQLLRACATLPMEPTESRPHVAVGSLEGVLVNQHLGEANALWIFRREGERFVCVDSRETPPPGQGAARWETLARTLHDCSALLVSGAGSSPQEALTGHGIRVIVTEGIIESLLEDMWQGKPLPAPRIAHACGVGCSGTGTGCG